LTTTPLKAASLYPNHVTIEREWKFLTYLLQCRNDTNDAVLDKKMELTFCRKGDLPMALYRGMKGDKTRNHLPQCGQCANTLGVRSSGPFADIPIVNDRVKPETGGMSVVCNTWEELPPHRKPLSKGGDSENHLLFAIEETALPPTLIARADRPDQFPAHRSIEPASECLFIDYQQNLHSTQEAWSLVE
jgi:hypothetical protein